jgi:hypothetical protein
VRNQSSAPQAPAEPFPSLFTDAEIDDRLRNVSEPRDKRQFQPIAVIRRYNPEIAAQLELLWGSSAFGDFVHVLAFDPDGTRRKPLRPDVLNSILALDRLHVDRSQGTPPIVSWVSDPTFTRSRPLR